MIKTGIHIIPEMSAPEIVETAVAAEALGYDYCLVCDEGIMHDVYVCLGAIAEKTTRLKLGPVTNGYTRHPAVTAVALASLNELSGGRALAVLVAGGTLALAPMGLTREAPLGVMRDTLEIMRRLWSGETVTWEGSRHKLDSARLGIGKQNIPVWLGVRGPKMLAMAGELADGVLLIAKSDLGPALEIVEAFSTGRNLERIYLDRIAYTPEMLAEAGISYIYAVMDAPDRMLTGMGLSETDIAALRQTMAVGGPAEAAKLITPEMIKAFQIAGTPDECAQTLQNLVAQHKIDTFLLNVTSPGLAANIQLMRDIQSIIKQ
ncbi:MAG TPA: LLM class flavin-dependent oxidoreductase [Anaerolineae bacterium]|nr:LLM class flavin-dependent oxidoreductase [Anaerolineae bacterium]HMR66254.1 LLM class flavin-dependent oxidoreductase [Anaerolineae bacterium]